MLSKAELAFRRDSEAFIVEDAECDNCRSVTRCLRIDTSEGEYGCVDYCLPCIQREFDEAAERLVAAGSSATK